jgi:hypothetical protein
MRYGDSDNSLTAFDVYQRIGIPLELKNACAMKVRPARLPAVWLLFGERGATLPKSHPLHVHRDRHTSDTHW